MPSVLSKPLLALNPSTRKLFVYLAGLAAIGSALRAAGAAAARSKSALPEAAAEQAHAAAAEQKAQHSREKPGVNAEFLKQLLKLLRICIPGVFAPEAFWAALATFLMAFRTYADLNVMGVQVNVESAIIMRSHKQFDEHMSRFISGFIPLALTNNLLKYALQELQMRCRARLTTHLLDKYMKGRAYYHVSAVDGRISNPEQLLTTDVDKLCSSFVSVFQQVVKPSVDACVYLVKLTQSIGLQGPGTMLTYLVGSGLFLTWLRRPTTRFTSIEQSMEGEYRFVHSRLLSHAEEVAFYGGGAIERNALQRSFDALMAHVRKGQQFRYAAGVVDSIIAKYAATLVGLLIISRPFLSKVNDDGSTVPEGRLSKHDMQKYYASARMLLNLSSAMGRLILAGRELARLAGFTARVSELDTVLDSLATGRYTRQFVTPDMGIDVQPLSDMEPVSIQQRPSATNTSVLSDGGDAAATPKATPPSISAQAEQATRATDEHNFHRGFTVYKDDVIAFDKVPLATPNNDVLVPSLSFEVPLGSNVLVAGPNGCGKSSLFRILGGLWPLPGGVLTKPSSSQVFYIPQRPYLSLGTLRDQILYPHTRETARANGVTDEDILQLLDTVQLRHLLRRYASGRGTPSAVSADSTPAGGAAAAASPGTPHSEASEAVDLSGLDAVQDWKDVLSGGEKQRVGMARVFYHRPLFVVNDEATSQVSADAESAIYARCRELGMTLFTVSHRRSLWQWHEYLLRFDGEGGYDFRAMSEADRESPFGS